MCVSASGRVCRAGLRQSEGAHSVLPLNDPGILLRSRVPKPVLIYCADLHVDNDTRVAMEIQGYDSSDYVGAEAALLPAGARGYWYPVGEGTGRMSDDFLQAG